MPPLPTRRADYLLTLPRAELRALLAAMNERQRKALRTHWQLWAHEGQLPPGGEWHSWLIMAGRGFGKTRAGAEWVRSVAEADPAARIAMVAASLGEARSIMVEGQSGLLATSPWGKRPRFEPSRRLLTWPNGAQAMLYSAGEPESLRGAQHSHACRTGPERDFRQRVGSAGRCAATLGYRDRNGEPASGSCRWTKLVGGHQSNWRLDWPSGKDRVTRRRKLAVYRAKCRHEPAQQGNRSAGPLPLRLASPCQTSPAQRRDYSRCRSAIHYWGDHQRFGFSRNRPSELKVSRVALQVSLQPAQNPVVSCH